MNLTEKKTHAHNRNQAAHALRFALAMRRAIRTQHNRRVSLAFSNEAERLFREYDAWKRIVSE